MKRLDNLEFTERQKESMYYALYEISKSENGTVETEDAFKLRAKVSLGNVFEDLSISALQRKTSAEHFNMLNALSQSQKDFFIKAVYVMIYKNDLPFQEEKSLTNQFFRALGISVERAELAISKVA